jgi:hypothetical protein
MQLMHHKRTLILLLGLGLLSTIPFSQAARLYKWQDETGKWHYGDQVPPEYANKERKVLNEQGVQVDTLERAKTPEEIAEEQRLAEQKRLEEQRKAEEVAHDHMLLATFTTEDDMILARDGKIAAIDSNIRVTNGRIENIEQSLNKYTGEAANLERAGKPVPDSLHNKILAARAQIQRYLDYIAGKRKEQAAIRQQFAADIRRFRELKQAQQQSPEQAVQRR